MLQLALLVFLALRLKADQIKEQGQAKNSDVCGIDNKYIQQKLNYLTTDFTLYGQRFLEEKKERQENEKKISEKLGTIDKMMKKYQKKAEYKLAMMDSALKGLQSTVSVLTKKVTDEMQRISTILPRIQKIETEIALLKSQNRTKTGVVSFSSYMTSSLRTTHHQTILFKGILTNEGGAYNPNSGIFTAPMNGLYYFHCSILTTIPGEYKLYVNRKPQMNLISDIKDAFVHSSNAVILNLKKDDHVFIKPHSNRGNKFFYVHHYWSNFSGFLIKAE